MNGKTSKSKEVSFGVPQGSILGQLLFILYINDISCKNESSTDFLFADDAAIKTTGAPKTIDSKRQLALINVIHWLEQNRLTLNILKKKQRQCLSEERKPVKTAFHFTRKKIENVKSLKYLGIILDHRLSFAEHINIIQKKMNQFTSMLYRLRKFLKVPHMIKIFKTYDSQSYKTES